jgi:hypothetical protein
MQKDDPLGLSSQKDSYAAADESKLFSSHDQLFHAADDFDQMFSPHSQEEALAVVKDTWNFVVDSQDAAEETASYSMSHAVAKDSLLAHAADQRQASAHSQEAEVVSFDRFWDAYPSKVSKEARLRRRSSSNHCWRPQLCRGNARQRTTVHQGA